MTLRHLTAILTLPFTIGFLVPMLLITSTPPFNPVWGAPFPINLVLLAAGVELIGGGLALVVTTIRLFMTIGQGTLAPWDPTQRLVVKGVYRYVRNPMISGVIAILLGEAALLGLRRVLIWAVVVAAVNMIYIPLVEEPGLYERFGADYEQYSRSVPRWLPRLTPWTPPSGGDTYHD